MPRLARTRNTDTLSSDSKAWKFRDFLPLTVCTKILTQTINIPPTRIDQTPRHRTRAQMREDNKDPSGLQYTAR